MMRFFGAQPALLLALLLAAPASPFAGAQAPAAGQPDASLAAYRNHLEALQAVVNECRRQGTKDACSPSRVGPDDQVQWKSGSTIAARAIGYDWLREVLRQVIDRAGKKEEPQKPNPVPALPDAIKPEPPVPVDTLLAQAQQRLDSDMKEAGGSAAQTPEHAAERKSIAKILARREYQGVTETSAWERLQEWFENLLASIFGHLIGFGAASPWIANLLQILLVSALCVALAWALIRIERRSRIRLIPDAQPAVHAPSARQWQLWFQDAQQMAAQGLWREAIHFLYWAAVSNLESRRMWPADRARTPREYLRLFPAADPRRGNLTGLTRSFETTWYGGREAGSSDFQAALEMAEGLGVK